MPVLVFLLLSPLGALTGVALSTKLLKDTGRQVDAPWLRGSWCHYDPSNKFGSIA